MAKARLCALILAAGYSSRMGAFKPLLPVGGSTVLEQAIARFAKAGITDIRVVVGYKAGEIIPILDRLGIRWVLNEQYEIGMLSSVLAGIRSLESSVDAFFLLPVDIPLVKPKTLQTLARAYADCGSAIIYPRFQEQRGHPPLISTKCIPKDLPINYPGGLRAFLTQYEPMAREVEVVDQAILMDCDTPADYEQIRAYAEREDIPTDRECEAVWVHYRVPERVIAHSRVVSQLARLLAVHLNLAGLGLNLNLIVAAGFLHDIAKGQPDHARRAGKLLVKLGYPRVAEVAASHMDISHGKETLREADLVYLADKYVAGDQLVSFEDRFAGALEKYARTPKILKAVVKRLTDARLIQATAEELLGQPLEQIIQRYKRNLEAVSNSGERKIFLVRHGAVQVEEGGKRFIGQVDYPMSREGVQQIRRLQAELRDVHLSAIFCSDLKRSVETAVILAGTRNCPTPVQRPELREINLGQWDGLTFQEVRARYPGEFEERGRDMVHYRPPGGESFLDCTERVIPAFFNILHASRGNVLIVAHAGVNRIILCQVLGMSLARLFEIDQDYGCLNVIRYREGSFTLQVLNGNTV